jgi:DNA-binding transcriptional ArsR family regulator
MSKLEDVMEIEDIAVFGVLNNRFRQRILRALVSPKPVKELAEDLDVPVTRLYYHVNQLLDAGLIRIVEERKVGAILEKVFQTTARSFRPGARLLQSDRPPAEMARIGAAVVLDPARLDAEAFLVRHFEAGAPADDPGTFGRAQGRLSQDKAEELTERIHELLDELDDGDDPGEDDIEFSLSVVFVPIGDAG